MKKVADRVKEITTNTSTAIIALSGAAAGYRTFAAALKVGDTGIPVCVSDLAGNWEIGVYTLTDAQTLTRERVESSSNNGAAVVFPAGPKEVFCTIPAYSWTRSELLRRLRLAEQDGGYPAPHSAVAAVTINANWTPGNVPTGYSELTLTVAGMQAGDGIAAVTSPSAVAGISVHAWRYVSATEIAVMFNNTSGGALAPASGSWAVKLARFSAGFLLDLPLVGLSAQGAASTVGVAGDLKVLKADSGNLRLRGSWAWNNGIVPNNTYAYSTNSQYTSGYRDSYLHILEFMTDAPKMDILLTAYRAPIQVIVDGKIVTPVPILMSYTNLAGYRLAIDFTRGGELSSAVARKPRKIRIEMGNQCHFGGLTVLKADTVWLPSNPNTIKSVVFGDSYVEANMTSANGGITHPLMSIGTTTYDGFANRLGDLLGWDEHITSGVGSTGYLAAPMGGAGQTLKWRDRIGDIISKAPDVAVIVGSVNDSSQTAAALRAEVAAFYTQLVAALPNTIFFVAGMQHPTDGYNVHASKNTAIKDGVADVNSPNLFFIDIFNWVAGTGTVSSPAGNTSDALTAPDGIHLSPAGHPYMAHRLAGAIMSIIKSYLG